MANISTSDIIFARVLHLGRELTNLRLTGIGSEADLFAALRHHIGRGLGMVELIIRNGTAGWSVTRPVMFA